VRKLFPIVSDLKKYDLTKFRGDGIAGITVGIMLIPQGMAYAMLAGLPPVYGLYAAIFPQIIYALLGSSRQLAVGPVSMDSIIVASGISVLAVANTGQYITLAILLAFLMGLIQISMGLLKLGFIVNFLSKPVINGFTYAAALVISLSQLKHLLGIDLSATNYTHEIILQLINKTDLINWLSVSISLFGMMGIWFFSKWNNKIPGALIVVISSIIVVGYGQWNLTGLRIVGEIPSGLPGFEIPDLANKDIIQLLPIAATLALIGFMEAYSVSKRIQLNHKTEYTVDANRELISLGAGNMFGSFFSSFPTSGGFSRSAVNESSGAKTGIASLISAGVVLITLVFFTPLFYYLPNAILASVIIMAVLKLIDLNQCIYLWRTNRSDFYMLLGTFLSTLFIGIKEGIIIGVSLSLIMMIYQTTRPHLAVLGKIPGTTVYKNLERFAEAEEVKGALIIRFDSRIYFANVNYLTDHIEELVNLKKEELKLLIIDAQSISSVDSSGMQALNDLHTFCRANSMELVFTSVIGPVRDTFAKEGFAQNLGTDHFFEQIDDATSKFLDPNKDSPTNPIKFQTNISS
jgi:SulP family sulfate permease